MRFFFCVKALGGGRLWPTALVVAACFVLAACDPDGASRKVAKATPQGANAPRTSRPMPPATSAQSVEQLQSGWTLLDGRRTNLAELRGQAVVLDFYATYCPPCREEIPHLNALQRRYASEGLQIIGLNVGGADDRPKVPQFVRELAISYPLGNPDEGLVQTFLSDNTSIPQTYVFDRQGRLVQRFVGYDETMPGELERAIQTALMDKTATSE
jgi:thiol-disulfide isomerase/thioredoxin